ncbi:MAG: inositol monophosphatase family protein [Anaerolineae bacterium]
MYHAIREQAEAIARRAGALLLEYAREHRNQAATKTTAINLVTAADRDSEALIVRALQEAFPDHHIHGEEGGGYGPPAAQAAYRWYVDPLDGTTNFAHGYPIYAVNLALVDRAGEPLVGLTYDPNRDECFSAVRGEGATLNGEPIRVSGVGELRQALLLSGFPYDRHTAYDNNSQAWAAFLRRAQGVRRSGAAALDLAYVACGRVDGYWERGPELWDIMAGVLLVHEAGGRVTTYEGTRAGLYTGKRILASNGLIHQRMVDVLQEVAASLRSPQG